MNSSKPKDIAAEYMESLTTAILERDYSQTFANHLEAEAKRTLEYDSPNLTIKSTLKTLGKTATACRKRAARFQGYIDRGSVVLSRLGALESTVLLQHYLKGLDWKTVALENGYTYDGIMKVRRRALKALKTILEESEGETSQQP